MAVALIKAQPAPPRLTLAFAAALTLHLLIALSLPQLQLLLSAATSLTRAEPLPPPPPSQAAPTSEVIPIRLPLAGFQMQTELGAIERSSPKKKVELPSAGKPAAGRFTMSTSLGAAANEALAADQRAHPKPPPTETTRLVAELRLATGGGRVAGNGGSADKARVKPAEVAAPLEKKPLEAPPKPVETPKHEIAKVDTAPSTPKAEAPPPLPLQPPIRPQIYAPVQSYRGAAPENIAIAPPLPPRSAGDSELPSSPPLTAANAAYLGAQPAPDRGPGAAVGGRGEFFQKLTTHLFQTNQVVLAEAIRATPKLTVEVRFTIDRAGRVLGAQVMRSTGDPALDNKAAAVILRASPVPQLSADMPQARIELSFPVQIYR
jgi:protein TonB